MDTLNKLYWLASYPKSGNTWIRALLTNYTDDGDAPSNINQLERTANISLRAWYDALLMVDSSLLTAAELDALRPTLYRLYAAQHGSDKPFCKIHDAFRTLPDGAPIFPADVTGGVVYIIRDPRDVAISYAHHNSTSIDDAIAMMADEAHGLFMRQDTALNQVAQWMGSWSTHVRSWMDESGLPLLLIRYEDLSADTAREFARVIAFVGLPLDMARLDKAVRFSSFETLRQQERERGFREKTQASASFFRKGRAGDWRETLTPDQIARIESDHAAVMQRFGYALSR